MTTCCDEKVILIQPDQCYNIGIEGEETYDLSAQVVLLPANTGTIDTSRKVEVAISAGENLSAGRVVYFLNNKAYYYQPSNLALYGVSVGVTKTSALTNQNVVVVLFGELPLIGSAFTPNTIYFAGLNGTISTTPVSSGLHSIIGHTLSPDIFFVNIHKTVIR